MATIAEMLIGIGNETAASSGDSFKSASTGMLSGLEAGAKLAQSVEALKLQREKLKQKKAENDLGKYAKIMEAIKVAEKTQDPAIQNAILGPGGTVEKMAYALKADDVFTPETLKMFAKSPEVRQKAIAYQAEVEKKILSGMDAAQARAEVAATMTDPLAIAALDGERLLKAQELSYKEDQQNKRNAATNAAILGRQMQAQSAAPIVDEQKKLRADHLKFTNAGAKASAEAKLQKLRDAVSYFRTQVNKGKEPTGGLLTTGAEKIGAVGLKDPKLKVAMDNLKGSINLKESLDSQFALAEAQQQYAMRGVDVQLPTEENLARAEALLSEAEAAYNNKIKAFRAAGLSVEDAPQGKKEAPAKKKEAAPANGPSQAQKDGYKVLSKEEKEKAVKIAAKKFNISEDEARKALEAK